MQFSTLQATILLSNNACTLTHMHTHGEPLIHTDWLWADFYAHSCSAAVLLRIRPVGHVSQSSLRPGRQKMFAIIAYTNEAHVSKPNRAGHWWSDRATEKHKERVRVEKGESTSDIQHEPWGPPVPPSVQLLCCRVHWTRMIFACWKFWLDLITVYGHVQCVHQADRFSVAAAAAAAVC